MVLYRNISISNQVVGTSGVNKKRNRKQILLKWNGLKPNPIHNRLRLWMFISSFDFFLTEQTRHAASLLVTWISPAGAGFQPVPPLKELRTNN